MTVSRRLRFEILRRDGHTCRYCGAKAPDVTLTVDHVIPVALGGGDDPRNLVTACTDCNSGKSSVPADASIVEDVATDALRWKRAMEQARTEYEAERQVVEQLVARFREAWDRWTYPGTFIVEPEPVPLTGDPLIDHWHATMQWSMAGEPVSFVDGVLTIRAERGLTSEVRRAATDRLDTWSRILGQPVERVVVETVKKVNPPVAPGRPTKREVRRQYPLPLGWEDSIERFLSAGLTMDDLEHLLGVAMRGPARVDDTFRYFCGAAWRAITDLQESARRIIEAEGDHGPH